MPLNLSIKNVPDELAERLRVRARRNHRSMQGEVMAILEQAAGSETAYGLTDVQRAYTAQPPETAKVKTTGNKAMLDIEDKDVETVAAISGIKYGPQGTLTVEQVVEKIRKLGLTRRNEAAQLVREDRDR